MSQSEADRDVVEQEESHKSQPPKTPTGGTMFRHHTIGIVPAILLLIIVGSIFMATFPIYPKVSATVNVQVREPKFVLQVAKLERLTLAGGSSVAKNRVFLYPISTLPPNTFELTIEVSYGSSTTRQVLAQESYRNLQVGLYSFSVVLDPRFEQQNVFYHIKMTAKLPYELPIVIEADVPPT